jgi:hypothetical protein
MDMRTATYFINGVAKDTSNIIISTHAVERLKERDFLFEDVIDILRDGVVMEEARKEEKTGNWSYLVTNMRFRGGRNAAAVTIVQQDNKLFVKTVMWRDK